MPSIYVPLWPLDERHQLQYGDPFGAKDMKRLLRLHRRAAANFPRLIADGWELWFVRYAFQGGHEDVTTVEEARTRLASIGVPLGWVDILRGHQ